MSTTSAGHVLKKNLKRPNQLAEIEQVDARLQTISEKIIPSSPYLLTVPEAPHFRLSPSEIRDWGRGMFARNEEPLQYVSFLNRDFSHGLIRAVGGWDNEKGELMASSPNGQSVKSGTSTPKQGQTAGKKMTLADYRNKKAGGQPGIKEVAKSNKQEPKHERANGTSTTKEKLSASSHPQQATRKRSIEDAIIVVDAAMSNTAEVTDYPRSKKQRTSPPPPAPIKSTPKAETTPPPKLKIPSLLSPTLPAVVEEGLIKLDDNNAKGDKPQGKKFESTGAISSQKQTLSSQPDPPRSSQEGKSKGDANVVEKNRGRGASQSQNNKSSSTTSNVSSQTMDSSSQSRNKPQEKPSLGTAVSSSKATSAGVNEKSRKEPAATNTSIVASTSSEEPKKKSKIVLLKIPKARRKDALRLLQMPPARAQPKHLKPEERETPEKRNTAPPSPDIRRKVTEGPGGNASQTKAKRARPDEDQDSRAPPPKRSKHPNSLDLSKKPSTPIPSAFKSPSISAHGSAQKMQDNKSNPSRRLEAGDADVKTPQGSTRAGTPLAPNSIERVASRDGRSASIVSSLSGKTEEHNAWRKAHQKYSRLGRTLKHEADALFLQCEKKDEPQIEKKSIATGVETILGFMLAYTIADEMNGNRLRRNIDVQSWNTIFPYLHKVKCKTVGHTLLHGLLLQLEAVCHNSILFSEIERVAQLEAASLSAMEPDKQTSETPANGTINGAGSRHPSQLETIKVKGKIAEHNLMSQHLWTEGAFELSIEDLQQSFPITWRRKARAPLARTKEKLTLGALNGDFYIPMSSITTGIEAVRAGWSLLGEWCKKEDVDWVGKLGL